MQSYNIHTNINLPAATHRVGEGPWKAMLLRPSIGIRANSQPTLVVRYSAKYPSWQPRQGYSTGSVKLAVKNGIRAKEQYESEKYRKKCRYQRLRGGYKPNLKHANRLQQATQKKAQFTYQRLRFLSAMLLCSETDSQDPLCPLVARVGWCRLTC